MCTHPVLLYLDCRMHAHYITVLGLSYARTCVTNTQIMFAFAAPVKSHMSSRTICSYLYRSTLFLRLWIHGSMKRALTSGIQSRAQYGRPVYVRRLTVVSVLHSNNHTWTVVATVAIAVVGRSMMKPAPLYVCFVGSCCVGQS